MPGHSGTGVLVAFGGYAGAQAAADISSAINSIYAPSKQSGCSALGKAAVVILVLSATALSVSVLTGGTVAAVAGLLGAAWGLDAAGTELFLKYACSSTDSRFPSVGGQQ